MNLNDPDVCRYWPCDEPRDDEKKGFEGHFCSTNHMLKYEHIKADAEQAEAHGERHAQRGRRPW